MYMGEIIYGESVNDGILLTKGYFCQPWMTSSLVCRKIVIVRHCKYQQKTIKHTLVIGLKLAGTCWIF